MPGGALSSLALAGTTTATRGSGWVTKPQGIRSNHVKSQFLWAIYSFKTPENYIEDPDLWNPSLFLWGV